MKILTPTKAVTIGEFDEFLDWLIDEGMGGKDAQALYKAVAWAYWAARLRADNVAQVRYAVYPMELPIADQTDEDEIDWLDQLRDEVRADRVFARLEHPPKYSVKREIHRGV